MVLQASEDILHSGECRETTELAEHLHGISHQLHIIFGERRISDTIVRIRITVILIIVHLNRSIISQLVAPHHLDIHLDGPLADALVYTLIFIEGFTAGFDQIFKCPRTLSATKTVIYCLITDQCITIYWHKNEIFTNLSK